MTVTTAFFNNKGGVGKTTLCCNYAAYEARQGKRVLIVDLDPQCNSTQLVLSDEQWKQIYEDTTKSECLSIMGLLSNIRAGDSTLDLDSFTTHRSQRFDVDVIPGHPSLSIVEDILSESWTKFRGGEPGGARRSLWLRTLWNCIDNEYDNIIVDASPSLGAINRSALVGVSSFVTPMSPDLFSLYALDNITNWFHRWLSEYDSGFQATQPALESVGYGDLLADPLPIRRGYIGYTVQQYVSRTSGGEIRQTESYEAHRRQIPERAENLSKLSLLEGDMDLGIVPNMFSMIPLAQTSHSPISNLGRDDGLRGAQFSQQEKYDIQLDNIFARISDRAALLSAGHA